MSNLSIEERQYIALPTEAHEETCGGCGNFYSAPHDTICADEGDGRAMVNLVCDTDGCGWQSCFYWTLSDLEFRAVFGHDIDEYPDDEDDEDY